ncbi:diguanylate cyclase (GGDEF) domain-containing protein [Anaerobium acetethylicum]|uniref:Diguanylate cyclase (GGDEF) domain-containing protein n=2 Tax=Anaerobium acetethylicum TaxID=1619234 RepID=A0A1D3TQ32_9FIRM|nr:diguanylate cyclase (GGDEF) domain-containing protein [Anaerobium acetethylicum]
MLKNKMINRPGIYKTLAGLLLLVCTLIIFMAPVLVNGLEKEEVVELKSFDESEEKNVLFISSYTENNVAVPEQIAGLKSVFENYNINFDIEYMDTKRFDTGKNQYLFFQSMNYKLFNTEPYDAIIAGDDNALQFVCNYHGYLFRNVDIFFLAINDLDRAEIAHHVYDMTGIMEESALGDNIELAMKINPRATKVAAIIDNTLTGKGDKEAFYSFEEEYPELEFLDLNVSEYTFDEFKKVLKSVGRDTILLFMSMGRDRTGATLSLEKEFDMIKDYTSVPVYQPAFGGIGDGLLGGRMISYQESGAIVAEMVIDVFAGTPIESIEVISESPNRYVFDYEVMLKYNIDERLLPEDAEIINKPESFFEEYEVAIIQIVCIMVMMVIIFIMLGVDNIRRRAAEKALKLSNEQLGETYEALFASEEELREQYEIIQDRMEEIMFLNQKYEIAIGGTDSAVWELDINHMVIRISEAFGNVINVPIQEEENIRELIKRLFLDGDRENLERVYRTYKDGLTDEINIQLPIQVPGRDTKWILVRGRGVFDSRGELRLINGIVLDTTKLRRQEDYIEYLARHDYLTSLPNRREFKKKLSAELSAGRCGAVMLMDIDNFKGINDTLGHHYGDCLLKELAGRFFNRTDNRMFVSRFGGDEFLIMISGVADEERLQKFAEEIKSIFLEPFNLDGNDKYVNFSMGITIYPKDGNEIEQLIMNADTAMYNVKHSGKNNYMFYSTEMKDELRYRSQIETILREALRNDGFQLVYQPQVDVKAGNVTGFEALLRLKEYNIAPDKFIPVAEETGLIIEIGRWVAKEAVNQIASWDSMGFETKPVAINVSSKQVKDYGFFEYLAQILSESGINPDMLEIEITESILLENTEESMGFFNGVRNLGCRLTLDDFGTGFSSLNYLTYIPVNKIKLDKSLSDKFLGFKDAKVVNSLIALAHSLDLGITAEGIEEWSQYEKLKAGGCDFIQGYLFSRPLGKDQVEKIYDINFVDRIRKQLDMDANGTYAEIILEQDTHTAAPDYQINKKRMIGE